MQPALLAPRVHLFVCANRRPSDAPLGPGCGSAGDAVYRRLKEEVMRHRAVVDVWVTETRCLGVCPPHGATVAVYPRGEILSEVEPADAVAIYARSALPEQP